MELKEIKTRIFLSSMLAALMACSDQQAKTGNAENATPADSAVQNAEAVHKPTLEELTLPDTAYASVQKMTYVVDYADSVPAKMKYYDDLYADRYDRVMTFRRNLMRNADFGGRVTGTPSTIEIAWSFKTPTGTERWGGGSGWTGQPLYAHWTQAEMDSLRRGGAPLTADFGEEEVMVGSLCGTAFFLNFDTGQPSRRPLNLHNVVKGTMSLDPQFMNLYVGQGVPKGEPLGCQAFNLLNHERAFFMSDPKSFRAWQAFDSSPIVAGGYLFWAGENCSLYKFERLPGGKLRRLDVLRYKAKGAAPGIETSLCVYRNYGYFADNQGNVVCVNLNTMKPVWYYDNHDDTDGTIVCRVEDGVPYVYTACEVDKQGTHGTCHFVKLKALTGEKVWERPIPCNRVDLGSKILDGGMYCTPLLGQGDCQNLIFANICRNSADPSRGQLTAIDTATGEVKYTVGYGNFCWSSPVGFLNEQQQMFIFTADASGNLYLVRGSNGDVLCKKAIGSNFESSPCVVGNAAVVGCRGNKIFKFVIK